MYLYVHNIYHLFPMPVTVVLYKIIHMYVTILLCCQGDTLVLEVWSVSLDTRLVVESMYAVHVYMYMYMYMYINREILWCIVFMIDVDSAVETSVFLLVICSTLDSLSCSSPSLPSLEPHPPTGCHGNKKTSSSLRE